MIDRRRFLFAFLASPAAPEGGETLHDFWWTKT